jgi:putative transposase
MAPWSGRLATLFVTILADAGIQVVLSGVPMPRMNSIVERWILTATTSCSTAL